jgi:hypothetical protein
MNFRMACSYVQAVAVQKVFLSYFNKRTARLPSAEAAWRADRSACTANRGK